jgi:hypothetical protein
MGNFASVYALKEPSDGVVRYVGSLKPPRARYSAHLKCHTQMTSKKDQYIAELQAARLKPELEILEGRSPPRSGEAS